MYSMPLIKPYVFLMFSTESMWLNTPRPIKKVFFIITMAKMFTFSLHL